VGEHPWNDRISETAFVEKNSLKQLAALPPFCVFASLREKKRLTPRRQVTNRTGLMQDLLTGKVPVKADEPEEITE